MGTDNRSYQTTLAKEVTIAGRGLFTAEFVSVVLRPSEANSGIVFRRVDLPDQPYIPAQLSYVIPSIRCTCLGIKEARVQMVEHLLSALVACEIDNVIIDIQGAEVPALDGSALGWVELLERAGVHELSEPLQSLEVTEPVYWSEGEVHLVALPSATYRISYILHYPQSSLIGSQYYTFVHSKQGFKEQIAPCRTFSLYEEIIPFVEKGIIKGGGLHNAVVIQNDRVMNTDGLRFSDEMVRHKILDLIGDFALLSVRLKAHVLAVCSGHLSHILFARKIQQACQFELSPIKRV